MSGFWEHFKSVFNLPVLELSTLYKALAAVAISMVVWIVLRALLNAITRRIQRFAFAHNNVEIVTLVKRLIFYILILLTGSYIIQLLDARILEKLFYALFILLIASPICSFVIILLRYVENNMVEKTKTKVDDVIFDLLNKFVGVIVYLVAIVMALDMLGVNVMPFIAGAGVAGIAIGFAAKDTLSNLIAGVLLIIDRPFEIGDRIEVWRSPSGSATWGDVIDIGLRATKIQTTDNIVIVIPNNEIMTRDIINYSTLSSIIRVRVNIGVAYDTDIDRAKEVLSKVAAGVGGVLADPAPKVVVRNFGESCVDLQLRVWIGDARQRTATISTITDSVKTAFDREGIEIPFPRRDITIVQQIP